MNRDLCDCNQGRQPCTCRDIIGEVIAEDKITGTTCMSELFRHDIYAQEIVDLRTVPAGKHNVRLIGSTPVRQFLGDKCKCYFITLANGADILIGGAIQAHERLVRGAHSVPGESITIRFPKDDQAEVVISSVPDMVVPPSAAERAALAVAAFGNAMSDLRYKMENNIPPAVAEFAVQSTAELQAAIAQRDARIEELARDIERLHMDYNEACADAMEVARELAALKAQPSGVVLPERYADGQVNVDRTLFNEIRISEPVNEEGEPNKYIITEQQLQRIADLEFARLNSSPVSAGWMMPTAKQLEQALESVPSFHDLSAELIAPAMLEHLRDVISSGEYGDAYQGAREDLAIWKRRALESETKISEQDQIIENLGNALNAENGPTFMGEPVMAGRAGGVDERSALATLERFVETVRECYHLASSYSGCLDNVDEHGGGDHEDPICAVFHRLYYAMFDGEKGLEQARSEIAGRDRLLNAVRASIQDSDVFCLPDSVVAALTASAPNHSEQVRGPDDARLEAAHALLREIQPALEKYGFSTWQIDELLAAAPSAGSQGGDV